MGNNDRQFGGHNNNNGGGHLGGTGMNDMDSMNDFERDNKPKEAAANREYVDYDDPM